MHILYGVFTSIGVKLNLLRVGGHMTSWCEYLCLLHQIHSSLLVYMIVHVVKALGVPALCMKKSFNAWSTWEKETFSQIPSSWDIPKALLPGKAWVKPTTPHFLKVLTICVSHTAPLPDFPTSLCLYAGGEQDVKTPKVIGERGEDIAWGPSRCAVITLAGFTRSWLPPNGLV